MQKQNIYGYSITDSTYRPRWRGSGRQVSLRQSCNETKTTGFIRNWKLERIFSMQKPFHLPTTSCDLSSFPRQKNAAYRNNIHFLVASSLASFAFSTGLDHWKLWKLLHAPKHTRCPIEEAVALNLSKLSRCAKSPRPVLPDRRHRCREW